MSADEAWADATAAAALFAVDPAGLGGVALRALPGPVRERWLEGLRDMLPAAAPWRRLPSHADDAAIFGGLDLAATLGLGRPVHQRGLLGDADGGVVLLAMAERLPAGVAARLAQAADAGEVRLERDGRTGRCAARFGMVALDESVGPDERLPAALFDRMAFHLDLAPVAARAAATATAAREAVAAARAALPTVAAAPEEVEAVCAAASALGIDSLRAPLLALRTARAAAALAGRGGLNAEDLAIAGRLVLAPRATRAPAAESEPVPPETPPTEVPPHPDAMPPEEVVLAAVKAALPADVLARLVDAGTAQRARGKGGKVGAAMASPLRGRPGGVRRGWPRGGARLSIVETLRAAAPWQPLRRRDRSNERQAIAIRADDFRVTRHKERRRTTTVFAVDASGSAAFHRLAEAKGAVELLLAACYVRRDQVALIAFRADAAELLLPPTRSLVRAKRSLAGLPGGGGTPLAAGIDAAVALAEATRRRGESPVLVLLTDGQANVARDGTPGRAQAAQDALAAARRWRQAGLGGLLVDTAPQPQARARELAAAMDARYLALPRADAGALSRAVGAASPAG